MDIINEIRKKQNQLIVMINSTFDEIVRELGTFSIGKPNYELKYETTYPITNTKGFKGRKPIAVKILNKRITTPTWKKVIETILVEIIKNKEMENRLMALRNKLLGRTRTRISKNANNMRSPLKLRSYLYIETHYDTETLMNFLLTILNELHYDYNDIEIIIKN